MNKIIIALFIILGCVGCSPEKTQTIDYLLCNDTSWDNMAEIESGFFYLHQEKVLYYADKDDMTTWIPVCNKVECEHNEEQCNAYINLKIAQKGEKLYFSDRDAYGNMVINEVSQDGSGPKQVYQIPFEEQVESYNINGEGFVSSHTFIINYGYLGEDGMYHRKISRLKEDGTLYNLFSTTSNEFMTGGLFITSSIWSVRGEEAFLSSLLTPSGENVQNVLWRLDGDRPERVNLPEEIEIPFSYLSKDSFTYYESGQGFYKIDLKSGEKTLLCENQLEDGEGYVLTEDYMVECNRYGGYMPEEASLRIYNGEKWINISLPEQIANLDCFFFPLSIASDRIFFIQDDKGSEGYSAQLYYVMLDDETPEITYCTTFGTERYFEIQEESSDTNDVENLTMFQKIDIPVFDTEEYVVKVTGIGLAPEYKNNNTYKITMELENKSTDKAYYFSLQDGAINGLQVFLAQNCSLSAGEQKEHVIYITESQMKQAGISDVYDVSEYTDISFLIYEEEQEEQQKIIHIYPRGEEMATTYVRESLQTDKVIIDNEYAIVTIVGYEKNFMENDTVRLFIENKSNKSIRLVRETFSSINGLPIKQHQIINGMSVNLIHEGENKLVLPKCCAYYSISLPSGLLEANDIRSIESWNVVLQLFYEDNWNENLVNETFIIIP